MDISSLEDAVIDWHRLGHCAPLPLYYVSLLHDYFKSNIRRKSMLYVTFHLKTIRYFSDARTQFIFWDVIDSMLSKLTRHGSNDITRRIESSLHVTLTPAQRIQFGHTLPVSMGYPILHFNQTNRAMLDIIESPNKAQSRIEELMVQAFRSRRVHVL